MSTSFSEYNKTEYSLIPHIQRDYVQGSDRNAKKRDPFLDAIFRSLAGLRDSNGNPYSGRMDFIYGASESKKDNGELSAFRPIDGQQRLTTLWLIGWLLAQRSKNKGYVLAPLKYRTRHSTEQFCQHLLSYNLPEGCSDVRQHLKSEPIWMAERWMADPSVNAMLDLLAAADSLLQQEVYAAKIDEMAGAFFNNSPLEFEKLDMGDYDLTEDLYVKMNARGKHLTEFENWKAEFTDLLEKRFKSVEYKHKMFGDNIYLTLPEYFSYAIEHEWTDLLWPASLTKWETLDEKSKAESAYPRIDEQFINILDFITKALFYSQYPESASYSQFPKADETEKAKWPDRFAGAKGEWVANRRIDMYRVESNVITLFRLLDILCELSDSVNGDWNTFFASLLYTGRWDSTSLLINIFDEKNEYVNLFERCIEKKLTMPLEFLLWGMLNFCVKYPDGVESGDLLAFTRVLWGWILTKRLRREVGHLSVEQDVRVEYYPQLKEVLDTLLRNRNVYATLADPKISSQKELKAEIERIKFRSDANADYLDRLFGCQYLKGDFSNLYPALSSDVDSAKLFERFEAFYIMGEWEKTRILIEHGWRGLRDIYNNCPFYGKNGHWDFVLSTKEDNFKEALTSYLRGEEALKPSKTTIEYYVWNYKPFFNAHRNNESPSHLYIAPEDFNVTSLLDSFSFYFPKYRLCPYATTVESILTEDIVKKLNLYNSYENGDHGCLRLNEGKYWIECIPEGWRFDFSDGVRWHNKWQVRFIEGEDGEWIDTEGEFKFAKEDKHTHILLDLKDRDRVETCVAFIKALYELL